MRWLILGVLLLVGCSERSGGRHADTSTTFANGVTIDEAAHAPVSADDRPYVTEFAPFRIMDNLYYVGPKGVSSFLITTPNGDFLIDGGIAQTAPLIERNIAALGFSIHDVKYLLNTHAHPDHAGGLAQLKRDSGARLVASAADRPVLEAGRLTYRLSARPSLNINVPPVSVDQVIGDGGTLALGGVTLTAHLTPGHTAGCTSWSLPLSGADGAHHTAFIDCSETVAGQSLVPESYPGMVQDYRTTFRRVRLIQADVFLGSHGVFFDLEGKRARQMAGDLNAFVDPNGLQRFNDAMEAAFGAELNRQSAALQSSIPHEHN
jgi:metallo-beta-lactamase class B